jgi:hypothetical protein
MATAAIQRPVAIPVAERTRSMSVRPLACDNNLPVPRGGVAADLPAAGPSWVPYAQEDRDGRH